MRRIHGDRSNYDVSGTFRISRVLDRAFPTNRWSIMTRISAGTLTGIPNRDIFRNK